FSLEMEKADRSRRLGKAHPEMVALDNRIKMLTDVIAKAGVPGGTRQLDELDRHRLKLENELASLNDQIQELGHVIELDDNKAPRMAKSQLEVDRLLAVDRTLGEEIGKKQRERDQVEATQKSGGYEVQAITPPTDALQVAPVLYQSLLLGGILGLLL